MMPRSQKMSILIVDDNKDNVDLMSQILEDHYAIIKAYSGPDCIEKAASEKPNLILLDVNMPKMDGYDTLRCLKMDEATRDIPVIFASAYYTESPMVVKGLQQGAFDYLAKPIDEEVLLAKVQVVQRIKHAEGTLLRRQKMEALGQLTGGIVHDYNNTLGIIVGYSELMAEVIDESSELKEYIQEISHAGMRGARLTQKLLDFSRQKTSDITVLNINDLLLEGRDMLDKTLTARIQMSFDLVEGLWPVCLDKYELEDAILNMSINAMHAIDGNGQLVVKTENLTLAEADAELEDLVAGDYVAVTITDSGRGMDAYTKERIFEPFYSTKGEEGTGLGLSQVYGFVQRSKGRVTVHSKPREGTCFTLYFPRYTESSHSDESGGLEELDDLSGTETILLVDDEAALLRMATKFLTRKGYKVLEAEGARQALDILGKEPVDLIVSDIIMPDMSGYQLASIVQERYPDIKIQLTSGFHETRGIDMVNEDLREALLRKPYRSKDLLKKIRALLG